MLIFIDVFPKKRFSVKLIATFQLSKINLSVDVLVATITEENL